jgi:hypothetical protein
MRTLTSCILVVLLALFACTVSAQEPTNTAGGTTPTTVTAPPPTPQTPAVAPNPEEDLGGFLSAVGDAFKNKNWGVLAGLIIMLVVWVVGKFVPKMSPKYLPWVSAGLGILGSISTDLFAGGVWYTAIFNGLLIGAAASGMWSLVGKHVLPKKADPV